MLELTLNGPTSEEVMALLPSEQRRGVELAEQGIREAVYVAEDRSAVWTVWNCDSQEALEELTKTLPLYEFWNIESTRLADEEI
ncbi:MAG TPA: muconolactone Delta-isomerase family protein [Anaerolineales bacterium]|jgi:muconolactone delta-isomerase|nr:muconolactone Delta-isomerase family protein [Anaerolineales bacterium]